MKIFKKYFLKISKMPEICIEEGCKIRASCNIEGKSKLYCAKHKKENMVNVTRKRCIESDCDKMKIFSKIS
jgi:hypothetical protein